MTLARAGAQRRPRRLRARTSFARVRTSRSTITRRARIWMHAIARSRRSSRTAQSKHGGIWIGCSRRSSESARRSCRRRFSRFCAWVRIRLRAWPCRRMPPLAKPSGLQSAMDIAARRDSSTPFCAALPSSNLNAARRAAKHSNPMTISWERCIRSQRGSSQAYAPSLATRSSKPVLQGMNEPPQAALRVNLLRTTTDEALDVLRSRSIAAKRSDLVNEIILVDGASPEALADAENRWEQQGEIAAVPVDVLDPKPDMHGVELCSGRGNKTREIVGRTNDRGTLEAIERDAHKVAYERTRLRDLGIQSVRVHEGDATRFEGAKRRRRFRARRCAVFGSWNPGTAT